MRVVSSRPIVALIALLVTLQLFIMAAGIGGIVTVEAVRGFVVGEAQYTKAQQRAASALRRYVRAGNQADLTTFHREMAVPRSIGLARIVLETPDIADRYARRFLVRGNIHPADVPYLVRFYQLATAAGFLESSLTAWRKADHFIQNLDALALEIEAVYEAGGAAMHADHQRIDWLDRIDTYDQALTVQQDTFASQMGEATRSVRTALISGIAVGTLLLCGFGTLTGWRTIRTVSASEKSLIEGQRRFQDVAECAADWIWETDANDRFIYLSDRLSDALGSDPGRFIGMTRAEANGEYETEQKWHQLNNIVAERLSFKDYEYDRLCDEQPRRISISGKPVFDADGQFQGYRGTGRDVTQARQTAAQLKEAKERAEAASRSKSQFLANMSHELRTPLNAIIGFSEVMRDRILGPLDARYAGYAADINRSGQHLLEVINDILDLSRVEAGHIELHHDWVDLGAEASNAVRLVTETAANMGVHVAISLRHGHARVLVDPKRLRQILLNLLSNAVKFSKPGGSVTVHTDTIRGGISVTVEDHGVGIPADQISKVLEPFGQADQSLSRPHNGVGLGLSLVQRFAQLHGGDVKIESELGVGTVVKVTLMCLSDQAVCGHPQHDESRQIRS